MKNKKIIAFLALIFLVSQVAIAENNNYKNERVTTLKEAKELFLKSRFDDAIVILSNHFENDKITDSNDYVNPNIIEGRNLLGDCYRLTGQYFKAISIYAVSAENAQDSYSCYADEVMLSLVTLKDTSRVINFPQLGIKQNPSKYDLFHAFLKIMDLHDKGSKSGLSLSQWSKQFNWPNTQQLGWSMDLLKYFQGLINEEQLCLGVPDEELATAYFYIGLNYELNNDWSSAQRWYLQVVARNSTVIETILAKGRLGILMVKNYDVYGKKECYEASSSLIAIYSKSVSNSTFAVRNNQQRLEVIK